jgi:hypothetical protein
MSLFQANPAEEGLFAVLTVKNLCWGQNCDLVLFGSKKNDAIREITQFATCGILENSVIQIPRGP